MQRIESYRSLDRRDGPHRAIGGLCTLIGAILLAVGSVLLVSAAYVALAGVIDASGRAYALAPALAWLAMIVSPAWSFGILISGAHLIALGGVLRLMVHLEQNTRETADLLDQIRARVGSGRKGPGPPPLS